MWVSDIHIRGAAVHQRTILWCEAGSGPISVECLGTSFGNHPKSGMLRREDPVRTAVGLSANLFGITA